MASISSGIADAAKDAGVVLAALSGAAYGCGYLVLRARAHALGTDPGFALIDQAYVFAGFRFVLALLFALLVMTPLLLVLDVIGRLASRLEPGSLYAVEVVAAVLAGGVTIWAYVATLGVNGVLLTRSPNWLGAAALGRNNYGTVILLLTTGLAAALFSWCYGRFARPGGPDGLGMVLMLIGALLLVLLPVQHGVFHADRNARRLDRVPDGVSGIEPPLWLVDRGASDRVVLYGRATDGQGRLITLKQEKIDGIATTSVDDLGTAVGGRKT